MMKCLLMFVAIAVVAVNAKSFIDSSKDQKSQRLTNSYLRILNHLSEDEGFPETFNKVSLMQALEEEDSEILQRLATNLNQRLEQRQGSVGIFRALEGSFKDIARENNIDGAALEEEVKKSSLYRKLQAKMIAKGNSEGGELKEFRFAYYKR